MPVLGFENAGLTEFIGIPVVLVTQMVPPKLDWLEHPLASASSSRLASETPKLISACTRNGKTLI
jgi:hypothetical protein